MLLIRGCQKRGYPLNIGLKEKDIGKTLDVLLLPDCVAATIDVTVYTTIK